MLRVKALAALLALAAAPAAAVECGPVEFGGEHYTICKVKPAEEELQLFLYAPDTEKPYGSFTNVNRQLARTGRQLAFAMNAGMYHSDRRPVGHYVEDGKAFQQVMSRAGPGNFGLLPNGVLCLREGRADVYETLRFKRETPACRGASQSGPMLVIDGRLHPKFRPDSDSRHVRNGVGSSRDGKTLYFAISQAPVTFHEFGSLFRDYLKTPQALYLDGNISRLYAPAIGRDDFGLPMGPIVGVVEQAE